MDIGVTSLSGSEARASSLHLPSALSAGFQRRRQHGADIAGRSDRKGTNAQQWLSIGLKHGLRPGREDHRRRVKRSHRNLHRSGRDRHGQRQSQHACPTCRGRPPSQRGLYSSEHALPVCCRLSARERVPSRLIWTPGGAWIQPRSPASPNSAPTRRCRSLQQDASAMESVVAHEAVHSLTHPPLSARGSKSGEYRGREPGRTIKLPTANMIEGVASHEAQKLSRARNPTPRKRDRCGNRAGDEFKSVANPSDALRKAVYGGDPAAIARFMRLRVRRAQAAFRPASPRRPPSPHPRPPQDPSIRGA